MGNGLSTAEEGGPSCTWTDADLVLALDLLGLPAELRHLDAQTARLESLRARAWSGSDEAVTELRELIADEIAELERQREEVWEGVEQPRLQDWCSGLEMDLGPEGARLHRYEMAADRLFRSAWAKLERLRKESGEPLMCRSARMPAPDHVPRPPAAAPPAPAPARPQAKVSRPSLLGDPAATVLDFWVSGSPRPGISPGCLLPNKTNPTPSQPANGGRAARRRNLP